MPADNSDDFIGFLRYDGELVIDGVIDARAAATALNGFDQSLRYFVTQQRPELATVEFPIPVRMDRGSWTAYLPSTIEQWIETGFALFAARYIATAAKQLAEQDFKDIGLRDVFKKALHALQWFARIGKHLGSLQRRIQGLVWSDDGLEAGIPNAQMRFC